MSPAPGLSDRPLAVLGGGTMGSQIAVVLAFSGQDVRLWVRDAAKIDATRRRVDLVMAQLVDNGLCSPTDTEAAAGRLSIRTSLSEAVADAGFVIEAIAEDLAAKQDVLRLAETVCDPTTVLSSTTSALNASEIGAALENPGRFVIAHFAQPAHLVDVVEVVAGASTSEQTVDAVNGLLAGLGKRPVRCPDIPGFLWARIQHAILREFVSLVEQGHATPADCDLILKAGLASRLPAMGSFEHADLAGLDLISGPAAQAVWADLSNASNPADTLIGKLVLEGRLGMKTGEGFYDWTIRDPDEFKRTRDEEIVRRSQINREKLTAAAGHSVSAGRAAT
ncbi:3-hydroxybutyryl-CoA dehydrogenase [Sinomonas cellulolyticus]|uniref:3-hydroxyacyl-CoA dehydrogenase family protein n=1 Tax=Sinomonas cellulolyticus TaxID=2801916 RepID=A0ABS1JY19_9MICC|nr:MULTISPECIES: 3-hydroxyacyl-CoA dehydrogenase family protein [Sinomonas]MBL0703997.1 3-hydroxyacyl-CoA dehydrogenase family protein [Sinomonas cellulolyticus]GHG59101.1 3-hydroxybutyryl-CoA dehydrogenase [Sinomonas sp. KCTC 49339]